MKQLNTKDWTTIEDMGGLILFVQLMEELLFHFNTHSNKVHATKVRTLVFEANNILMKIDVEKVKSSNILPVIEEIKKNIQSDSVAKELLGIKEDYLIKGLNSTENFSEISASIDAMMRHLGNGRYSIIEYVQKVIFSGIEIKNFEAVVYDCNIDNDYHKNTLINAATKAVNKDNYKSLILGYKI